MNDYVRPVDMYLYTRCFFWN